MIGATLHGLILAVVVDDEWSAAATTLMPDSIGTHTLNFPYGIPLPIEEGHTLLRGGPRVAIVIELVCRQSVTPHLGVEQVTCMHTQQVRGQPPHLGIVDSRPSLIFVLRGSGTRSHVTLDTT